MNIAIDPVRTHTCDVAIVGAGPYGLAAAAHLRAAGVETRMFGEPMSFWRSNMPHGMKLRSPWVATHFAHPHASFSLDDFYREAGLSCRSSCRSVNFVDYGVWFQRRDRARPRPAQNHAHRCHRTRLPPRARDGDVVFAPARGDGGRPARPRIPAARIRQFAARAGQPFQRAHQFRPAIAASASQSSAAARARASQPRCCMKPASRSRSSRAAISHGTPTRKPAAACAGACAPCSATALSRRRKSAPSPITG